MTPHTIEMVGTALVGIALVVTLVVAAQGAHRRDGVNTIIRRARWPFLFALLALPIAVPRMQRVSQGGILVLLAWASWSAFRQHRSNRRKNSR
jgi:hypothetical protein